MKWVSRHSSALALALSILIMTVLAYGSFRKGYLDFERLARQKDALSALNSIVTTAAILLAFSLSYFRFFFGRTFARRANVEVSVMVAQAPDGSTLHAISLGVNNIGTLTIHDPHVGLKAWDYREHGKQAESQVETWLKADEAATQRLQQLIDPGETAYFHAVREVDAKVWASSYAASVVDDRGNVWVGYATTSAEVETTPQT